jgi:hypothetical protein
MSTEIIEAQRKILSFLYWEETVDNDYHTLKRIQDETELSETEIREELRTLGHSGLVSYVYRERDIGIEEAKITDKGKEKARQLIND